VPTCVIAKLYASALRLVIGLAATAVAHGYVLYDPVVSWTPGTITMQVKLGSTKVLMDGTNYTSSAQAAMQSWNAQLGTVQFVGNAVPESDTTAADGVNEIVFNDKVEGTAFGDGVIAITLTSIAPSIHEIRAADIIVNRAFTWDSYRGTLTQTPIDLRRVLLHELGHVLGIGHAANSTSIMFKSVTNVDTLSSDDIQGAQVLYGAPGATTIPANDAFASATNFALSANSVTFTGSTVYATKQTGEPQHAGNAGGHSVWWRWTAPVAGSMTVTTDGSRFDTMLGVYTGANVSTLIPIASNDDLIQGSKRYSSVTFAAARGVTYYFAVDGWDGTRGFVQTNYSFTPAGGQPAVLPSRLANLSARGFCSTGDRVMIGGFVISGSSGTTKRVLVRAVGPTLTSRGIGQSEVLLDPVIEVHKGSPVIASNDNWGENTNLAEIVSASALSGAADLDATDTKSSVLLLNLAPGVYSFIASGKGATSGIVLLEVYDVDANIAGPSFANIATRAQSTTGNGVTIGGFVISGTTAKQVLLRATGPSLTVQNLPAADLLADPTIELHDALNNNVTLRSNDNWSDEANAAAITTTAARIGATPFASTDTKSSALLLTLNPGVYSFIAGGKSNTSGIVLVEVYDAD
jgi:hypothetical protein